MLLDNFRNQIILWINENKSQSEMAEILKNQFGPLKGISQRSIRRFISENNLLNKITDDGLNNVISEIISNVGPSYGRSMLTGALRSLNIGASARRVAKAAILADPSSHRQRLEVLYYDL